LHTDSHHNGYNKFGLKHRLTGNPAIGWEGRYIGLCAGLAKSNSIYTAGFTLLFIYLFIYLFIFIYLLRQMAARHTVIQRVIASTQLSKRKNSKFFSGEGAEPPSLQTGPTHCNMPNSAGASLNEPPPPAANGNQ